MSGVPGTELADAMDGYAFAYLMTVTDAGEAHAVAVQPRLSAGVLQIDAVGSRSRGNIGAHPQVSLVWPPADFDGYSLIVNGTAQPDDQPGIIVTPTRAVLHRPHEHEGESATGCGSDCVPLSLE
ncbi:pyridoxamine 5'-phosphate oxidase family protein [Leekyejoonella antrihumi]|uniref:Pyridoxamine 5'-phosphate oxidase family protein n=1 Tax=Leekyejoonella antrihumi TaxID=1660198 RepID=A0A563E109_9MICO|nr:pyridoxamine 5'-phosphate oxidase family protein [Leekyejoonella antrihumi]TWP36220.1 pyridoxamine 5'-phosphate oxidase family protein [Leekyejoonella antrihumi]